MKQKLQYGDALFFLRCRTQEAKSSVLCLSQNFNKPLSKSRRVAKQTFGGMKRWFGAGIINHKGKKKLAAERLLEAIFYN